MNKAEKIKAEIERLKNVIEFSGKLRCFPYAAIFLDEVLGRLLSFIDSLEQPIKRTPADIEAAMQEVEEKSKLFTEAHKDDVVSNDTLKVISNDLEEAATKYARKQLSNPDYPTYNDEYEMECAFEAGAQWQKQQDQSTIELAEDHAYLAGQEKIIAKACNWLTDNYSKYIITNGLSAIFSATIDFDIVRMIEDFKKAMEE